MSKSSVQQGSLSEAVDTGNHRHAGLEFMDETLALSTRQQLVTVDA